MKTTKKKIRDCKEGDIFSISPNGKMPYLNIIVPESIKVVYGDKDRYPFNVIALGDGRPRTFDLESMVHVIDKEDLNNN